MIKYTKLEPGFKWPQPLKAALALLSIFMIKCDHNVSFERKMALTSKAAPCRFLILMIVCEVQPVFHLAYRFNTQ